MVVLGVVVVFLLAYLLVLLGGSWELAVGLILKWLQLKKQSFSEAKSRRDKKDAQEEPRLFESSPQTDESVHIYILTEE